MRILIVCVANYCRSPVAEKILQEMLPSHDIASAGINPYPSSTMDSRSIDFLQMENIKGINHLPKRVTKGMIDNHDLILAMDITVLHFLNNLSPNNKSKYKIFNFLDNSISVADPVKLPKEKYNLIMKNIYELCIKIKQYFA
tara:strand:+ start:765 stop:1190 length:426 start_codon:yes stop_codon:yes gene_type:complete